MNAAVLEEFGLDQDLEVAQVGLVAAIYYWAALTDEQRYAAAKVIMDGMSRADVLEAVIKTIAWAGFDVEPYEPVSEASVGMYL